MFTKIVDRLDFIRRIIINFFFVIFLTIFLIGLFIFPFFKEDNVDVKGHILSLKTNDISDQNSSYLSPQNNLTIYEVVKAFEIASTDDDVEIIFIDVSYLNISSVSAYEVGKSINLLKEKGKKVIAYGDFFTQSQYLLASYADEIILNPFGMVYLEGFKKYQIYLKEFLINNKINVNTFVAGDYKSATEIFTNSEMSLKDKEQSKVFLNDLWNNWVLEINKNRKNLKIDINYFINQNKEILIVSSGALALGKKVLNIKDVNLKISEKQAIASVGQITMINGWKKSLSKFNLTCGQILLTHNDAETRRRSINARNTIESLIKMNSLAIINENDTTATKELKYGDNDQLAARVAQLACADILILLSDIDGLYEANPEKYPNAKLIKEVKNINKKIVSISENTSSSNSVGGMETKIKAAKIALAAGCNMIITKGSTTKPIKKLLTDGASTWFFTHTTAKTARKKWISSQQKILGSIIIDEGAVSAIKRGASLLPAGILEVKGSFSKGDIIYWRGHVAVCLNRSKLIHAYGPRKKVLTMDIKKTIELIKETAKLEIKKIIRV
mgnify:CR=1 FL=1